MVELKVYSGKDESDEARTTEIKRFSEEKQSGPAGMRDREEATMEQASTEIFKRARKVMIYRNASYQESAKIVVAADPELGELWVRGYIKE